MKFRLIAILLLIACVFAACDNPTQNGRRRRSASLLTPVSSGNPYEVMVVADDSVWNGYAGAALQRILDNIGKEYTKAKMTIEKDVHSTPQMILTLNAPNQVEASVYITEHAKGIEGLIASEEINRTANDLYFQHNIKFAKKVKEMFDCEFYIPVDIKKMKVGEDFIWASDDGLSSIQNICIYSLPYVSEKMFTKSPYIALRDTIMKRNIPGEKPNQWMQTNAEFVWTKNITVNGKFAMEARGLWDMRNDAMGGPFVSHSRLDEKNNRVIVVEGFVYAPDKMKRTMLRRLEAALYTLETPSDEDNTKEENGKN